ncbi:pyridoxal-dependent decarboxylase (plasmid) [Nostoc sp. UHCC 0926]|uniref:pyridoxal phosphate-dependent decarboxylase family protein n=1 Tax=Nostoc sp. UHCC 0926 TaxID=3025190 RepID=UPI0023600EDC|nr:pyridoxal-dependent decarboxylase [Nostoc sp. UHCC 0926]WDD30117.1 pyridoxal-dependent decarboxylase [Nostoc sp. UHCC 0926]
MIDILINHFETVHNKPVATKVESLELKKQLYEPMPQKGINAQVVMQQLQNDVFSNVMHHNHPRFFAYVPSPNNFISAMADTLASGMNIFAGSYKAAPGATEIELVTIDWLRQICGLPPTAGGLFVSGGTMANLTGLTVARRIKLQNNIKNAVVYYSDQTHSSVERALYILGFDHTQMRKLPSDENFCLRVSDLKDAVFKDLFRGKVPFCVVANAGTTNTGAVDPLSELSDFCLKVGLWLHVDGAYGAASILCERGRSKLEGLEFCDSLSLDPHKRLFQSYEAGCLLVREKNWLKETFCMHPEYLNDLEMQHEEINFYDYGIQLTRSFKALKLWMSIKVFGIELFEKAIQQGIVLAETVEQLLRASTSCKVVSPAQLGIITFQYIPKESNFSLPEINLINSRIIERMAKDGFAMLSSTQLRNRLVLRMCTINPSTTEADIRKTLHKLESFGKIEASILQATQEKAS